MATKLRISRRYDLKLNLRHALRIFGYSAIRGNPHLPAKGEVITGLQSSQSGVGEDAMLLTGQSQEIIDNRPIVPNLDIWKIRIPRKWRTKMQRRIKWLREHLKPRQLTEAELSERKENETRRRLEKFHREQTKRCSLLIIEALARLGYCHRIVNNGREVIKSKVRFDRIQFSPLIYRYHVDARRLPYGTSIVSLYSDDVCTDLSASVEHPVRAEIQRISNYVTGLWYTVEIAATLGIPNKCLFADLLPLIPDSAPPLAFLVGYGENKRPYWRSLEEMPHFLGGGQTNGGKSNFMHNMLCTMIARNKPNDVRLLLIDLKFDGIELARYEGLPHLITDVDKVPTGVACNADEGLEILSWIAKEGLRRGKMFKGEKIQNLKLWNRKHKTRHLPEIVVAIDELALMRLDRDIGSTVYDLIQEISSTARAAGIHLVAFTQSSNKRVVDEMIKVNLPGRICFSVPDASSSILFVGDGSAINLMPAGRAVWKFGTDTVLVQTPLIDPSDVKEIVDRAIAGQTTRQLSKHTVSPEEIIDWAIENNGSSLAVKDVYLKFGYRTEKAAIERLLQSMEGETHIIGDRNYQVLPGTGRKPRIVVRVDGTLPSAEPKT